MRTTLSRRLTQGTTSPHRATSGDYGPSRDLTIGDESGPTTDGSDTTRDRGALDWEPRHKAGKKTLASAPPELRLPESGKFPTVGVARSGAPTRRSTEWLKTRRSRLLMNETNRSTSNFKALGVRTSKTASSA
ncbi:hypothetical protein NDU88_005587 [Pleurodeles waltl]|uniref:Uncharacterized protein n=1 Tax=Pleurodeles waltl TaxID=8319 RepID=A0AAV7MZS8_PLEWA|nr:hypothetical protein NDU88_005587 [Pleurodeles waltl]